MTYNPTKQARCRRIPEISEHGVCDQGKDTAEEISTYQIISHSCADRLKCKEMPVENAQHDWAAMAELA